MTKIKKVTLGFSCPESKANLKKAEKNYQCDKCQHQVIDFTCASQEELSTITSGLAKPVCGIFKRSQLSKTFLRYMAATMVVTTAAALQVNGQDIPEDIPEVEVSEEMEVFGMVVETMAIPAGGNEKFYEAIMNEIRLPKKQCFSGKVYIQFTVDTLGNMKNIEVVKGLHKDADAEAVRVLNKIDFKFTPAALRGKKMESRMIVPVSFGLK